ncbi:MAG: hypothetical protein HY012_07860 [Acidobacteria bacterium]|nr:hypothetical protein [Acidobacteriota bacterium]
MKKQRIRKPDGRYLIYYSFEPAELSPATEKQRSNSRRCTKRRAAARRRGR